MVARQPATMNNGESDEMLAQVERLKPGMAEAVFDLAKESPEQQISSGNSLDTKMVQIFAAASIVMGLLGLSSSNNLTSGRWWTVVLLVGALASYVFTAVMAFKHLEPKEYWRNLEASRWLHPDYQSLNEDEFRRVAIVDTARAYAHNSQVLRDKGWYMRRALISTTAEVLLVSVTLILYRLI